jgi:hypothetical protein
MHKSAMYRFSRAAVCSLLFSTMQPDFRTL